MKKLLIADEDRRMIEGDVNRVYLDIDEPPFEFQITTTVDEAIKEIKRFPYELVLSSEFLPEAVPGKLWDDVLYRGDVLRLLEFCTDNAPRTKVCIVSTLTLDERLEELYRSYPCVLDVFGRPHSNRVYKAQDKRLRKILDTFAGERTVV